MKLLQLQLNTMMEKRKNTCKYYFKFFGLIMKLGPIAENNMEKTICTPENRNQ